MGTEEAIHKYYGSDKVMASMLTKSGDKVEEKVYRLLDFPVHVKLEKFLEDVKCGIFPLTAFALAAPLCSQSKPETPDLLVRHDHDELGDPETQDGETRRIDVMHCSILQLIMDYRKRKGEYEKYRLKNTKYPIKTNRHMRKKRRMVQSGGSDMFDDHVCGDE